MIVNYVSHLLWKLILFSIQNLNYLWRIESDGMDIRITIDKYINMTLKNKITTLNNLIKKRQMTLNVPKFDIKNPLDTLVLSLNRVILNPVELDDYKNQYIESEDIFDTSYEALSHIDLNLSRNKNVTYM